MCAKRRTVSVKKIPPSVNWLTLGGGFIAVEIGAGSDLCTLLAEGLRLCLSMLAISTTRAVGAKASRMWSSLRRDGGLPMTHFAPVRFRALLVFRQHQCNVLVRD
jgi:hypothetical protein